MPELLNQSLYDATYKATESVVKSTKANFKTFQTELTVGTALYRYSTKQYSDGKEAGARKNWTKLETDTGNRWTGTAKTGSGGSGGLYMSLEAEKGLDTEFPELNHYQGKDQYSQETDIAFYDFKENRAVRSKAKTLYYMFTFFLKKKLVGIDLTLNSWAIRTIYAELSATGLSRMSASPSKSAEELYMDGEDASFCRAIGNGCFRENSVDFILVSSTRNTNFKNVILKCPGGETIDYIQAFGRSSFYLDPDAEFQAVETEDDKVYNDELAQSL